MLKMSGHIDESSVGNDAAKVLASEESIGDILNDEIEVEDAEEEKEAREGSSENSYQLCSGDVLSCKDIYQIAAKEKTKMIVFIGPAESGKTTIETSIYQMFFDKPVDDFYFAGSKTLQGYEQRAFFTRVRSHGIEAKTPHTNIDFDQPCFLHLKLWEKYRESMQNFVFTDLSGESYESHIGQIERVKENYSFFDRADYIIGVLDGNLLRDKRKIQSTVSGMIELLRTFYDAKLINEECILQIVFSKYDLLYKLEGIDRVINRIKKQVENSFKEKFQNIEYFKIAAMPESNEDIKIGYGLEELLRSWEESRAYLRQEKSRKGFVQLSEYDRLDYKF